MHARYLCNDRLSLPRCAVGWEMVSGRRICFSTFSKAHQSPNLDSGYAGRLVFMWNSC